MQCIFCHYPATKVIRTTTDEDLSQIYRRRECIKCGRRYTTREHLRESESYKRVPYQTLPPRKVYSK